MKYYLFVIIFILTAPANAQESGGNIWFDLTFDQQPIQLERSYYSSAIGDSIKFEALKFYISNIQLLQDKQPVTALDQQHFLIDLEDPNSLIIPLPEGSFNKIQFSIGVDSLTNVSGAFGGDLDPVNGMYWTWQSGYINFKLEGVTNSCPARNHRFQFHLGGYQAPFHTLQVVELPLVGAGEIQIRLALDEWLRSIDLTSTYEVMSPNQQALEIAQRIPAAFQISQ